MNNSTSTISASPVTHSGKRVVVGLSGGVDSSVAAFLLKEQGYEVIGMFMKNWHDDTVTISNECPWLDDSNDAMIVAQHLGIPFQAIDLSKEYKERIVDYMFAEYQRGRTPNPDVLCNREIKFDVFLNAALKLGADFVATGHYCRKGEFEKDGKTHYRLLAGKDPNKDQSYFLCQLTEEQLSKALFPVGELLKPEVRAIAKKAGLATAEKKDSQGLCFVGKVHLPDFLQQRLETKKGKVIEVSMDAGIFKNGVSYDDLVHLSQPFDLSPELGEVVGEHNGAHYYTIGQRRGLNIGGFEKPLFVIGTDTTKNVIYTGMGEDHRDFTARDCLFPMRMNIGSAGTSPCVKMNPENILRGYGIASRWKAVRFIKRKKDFTSSSTGLSAESHPASLLHGTMAKS